MQKDAIERLGLTRLLLEPEMLDAVEPDVHLVGTLLSLSRVIPEQARESARAVVRTVTRDLERRLSAADSLGGDRGAEPGQPDEQATAARRHRLGPDDPRQPAELPAASSGRSCPSG